MDQAHDHLLLPRFLRHIRAKRGMRQNDLAQRTGVTRTHMCSMEQGRTLGPAAPLLAKMAEVLNLSARECETVRRLDAQDRVIRHVQETLPAEAVRLVAAALEMQRLAPSQDVAIWTNRLEAAVAERTYFIGSIQFDDETVVPR
ncbi:helix-turn-helix transcriptional regulator [Rubrivivax gelatinosus]|uniref:helix-turn-helix transcriptional regulator n=1 Tax=Rubrivivax gelatinosus TaxID=28068 RepID=UPI0021754B78|nr:helix-turn-helix transcriptional regulator [Rubrivivax gelatinosus]